MSKSTPSKLKPPTPIFSPGVLTIQILEATFKVDVDAAKNQKMDPYFTFMFKGKNHKTKIMKDTGKTPKWTDQIFKLNVPESKDLSESIIFKAFDDVLFKADQELGRTSPQKIQDLVTKN